jgi:hypothetical protein
MEEPAATGAPTIQNQPVTTVTTNSATFNGTLTSTGGSACAVCVLWGEQNGSQTWNWANTNWFDGTGWTNNSPLSTNITSGIDADKTYYYTFAATNETTNAVASSPKSFITGEVTVEATDGTAKFSGNTGEFTIRRPEGCTNAQLTVNFTMGGTELENTDYTLSPSGSVTMNAGESNKVVTLTPTASGNGTATLMLTLANGNAYPVGAASNATVNIQAVTWAQAEGGTVTNYTDAGGTNWTAHIFTTAGTTSLTVNVEGIVEVLVVGGGGAGGGDNGGGGGAGGVIKLTAVPIGSGSRTVTVGNGGTGGGGIGPNGGYSAFDTWTAGGGGGGGVLNGYGNAGSGTYTVGGSGGGSGRDAQGKYGDVGLTNGNNTTTFNHRGGSAIANGWASAGGGGGAGNVGVNGVDDRSFSFVIG